MIYFLIEELECMCGTVLGTHCGTRRAVGYLSVTCKDNHLYECPSSNFRAQDIGECNSCVTYELPGLDYCNATNITIT